MAELMKTLKRIFLLLALAAPAFTVAGDPTRPPPAFMPDAEQVGDVPAVVPQALVLQSILLSAGRQRAIISGQSVAVGGLIGDARLVRLNEYQAVLHGPHGMQTLELTPGIRKSTTGRLAPPVPRGALPHQSGDKKQ